MHTFDLGITLGDLDVDAFTHTETADPREEEEEVEGLGTSPDVDAEGDSDVRELQFLGESDTNSLRGSENPWESVNCLWACKGDCFADSNDVDGLRNSGHIFLWDDSP